jgi:hypothetical protein
VLALAPESIDLAVAAQEDALEAGQRLAEIHRRHSVLERRLKCRLVYRVLG